MSGPQALDKALPTFTTAEGGNTGWGPGDNLGLSPGLAYLSRPLKSHKTSELPALHYKGNVRQKVFFGFLQLLEYYEILKLKAAPSIQVLKPEI